MLSNAYLLAKFRFDTAENERNFAEKMPTYCSAVTPFIWFAARFSARAGQPRVPAGVLRSIRGRPFSGRSEAGFGPLLPIKVYLHLKFFDVAVTEASSIEVVF